MRHASEQFQFSNYDTEELKKCGEAFVAALLSSRYNGLNKEGWGSTKLRTKEVLRWFENTVDEKQCSVRSGERNGEFIFDLSVVAVREISCPRNQVNRVKDLASPPIAVKLALESEWGKYHSAPATLEEVLFDAAKLAVCRAKAKVLLFATAQLAHSEQSPRVLALAVAELRSLSEDRDPWLLVYYPWDNEHGDGFESASWGLVFNADDRDGDLFNEAVR